MINVLIFFILNILLYIPGYVFWTRYFQNKLLSFSLAYMTTLAFIQASVVLLGTFLNLNVYICMSVGYFGLFGFGVLQHSKNSTWTTNRDTIAFQVLLFLKYSVVAVGISYLFISPFTLVYVDSEPQDFYHGWGVLVQRLFEDQLVPSLKNTTDYSAYNYPILAHIWSLVFYTFTGSSFVLRYKILFVYSQIFMFLYSQIRKNTDRALFYLVSATIITYHFFFKEPLAISKYLYSSLTDLPFGLLMAFTVIIGYYALKKEYDIRYYFAFLTMSYTVSQVKYDGVFFHFVAIGIVSLMTIYGVRNKNIGKGKSVIFASMLIFLVLPLIWVAYEKLNFRLYSSFNNLDYVQGFVLLPKLILEIFYSKNGLWIGQFVAAGVFFVLLSGVYRRKNILLLSLYLPFTGYFLGLVFILGAEWAALEQPDRLLHRIYIGLLVVLAMMFSSFIKPIYFGKKTELFILPLVIVFLVLFPIMGDKKPWETFKVQLNSSVVGAPDYECINYLRRNRIKNISNVYVKHASWKNAGNRWKWYVYRYNLYPYKVIIMGYVENLPKEQQNLVVLLEDSLRSGILLYNKDNPPQLEKPWIILDEDKNVITVSDGEQIDCP
jgi:hypothetical protein